MFCRSFTHVYLKTHVFPNLQVHDCMDGTYEIEWLCSKAGTYSVQVLSGVHTPAGSHRMEKGAFSMHIVPGPCCAKSCTVEGARIVGTGLTEQLIAVAYDACGNRVKTGKNRASDNQPDLFFIGIFYETGLLWNWGKRRFIEAILLLHASPVFLCVSP